MRDAHGPASVFGYCTNVHPARTPAQLRAQLDRYATRVQRRIGHDQPLPIALWLPGTIARDIAAGRDAALHAWLRRRRLLPASINAFPAGHFHASRVRYNVYHPDWCDPRRLAYTLNAVRALRRLLPRDALPHASVSTLPLGWRRPDSHAPRHLAGARLRRLADTLDRDDAAPAISVDLEPEPGCLLQTADDVIRFFDEHLPLPHHRRHIGVCHDICHAAVMFEDQSAVLQRYARAGIRVNTVHVSNALRVPPHADPTAARVALVAFAEPRYLHQTVIRTPDGSLSFYDDLADALRHRTPQPGEEWRIHFHVPLHLDHAGPLATTRDQILPAIRAACRFHHTPVFAAETYAWHVLPPALRTADLAEDIAAELAWLRRLLAAS